MAVSLIGIAIQVAGWGAIVASALIGLLSRGDEITSRVSIGTLRGSMIISNIGFLLFVIFR